MKIKKINNNEFNNLMELMNTSFGFEGKDQFEYLLPKLYFKDNMNMIHYGVYEDNKLIASIGLYEMKLISKYGYLKAGCIGAVSTHPNYRCKGYFTQLMEKIIKVAKKSAFDILFLTGDKLIYNKFGFTNAGRKAVITLENRCKSSLKSKNYSVEKLNKKKIDDTIDCLAIYDKANQRILRSYENFYNQVSSWKCVPYIVKVNNKIVGYYTINKDNIKEIRYINSFKHTVLDACLGNKEKVNIELPLNELDDELLNICSSYKIENVAMFKILNWDNLAVYLNMEDTKKSDFDSLSIPAKTRSILGSSISPAKYSSESLFIYTCDLA